MIGARIEALPNGRELLQKWIERGHELGYRRARSLGVRVNGTIETETIVDGHQSRDGSHRANGRDLTLPNGQTLFPGSSGTGAPYEKK